jgi:hypothetical protein
LKEDATHVVNEGKEKEGKSTSQSSQGQIRKIQRKMEKKKKKKMKRNWACAQFSIHTQGPN